MTAHDTRNRHLILMRRLLIVLAGSLIVLTGAVSAHANPQESTAETQANGPAHHQTCSPITGSIAGDICIDATGQANTHGVIGVTFWQKTPSYLSIQVCWQNSGSAEFCGDRQVVGGGDSTAPFITPSFLTVGCNASPKVKVFRGGDLPFVEYGAPLCVA